MLTNTQFLLTKLAEEAAEVSQRALKAQQFGLSEFQPGQALSNATRLHAELTDLMGILKMLVADTGLPLDEFDPILIDAKVTKVQKYADYSRKCGCLEPEESKFRVQEITPATLTPFEVRIPQHMIGKPERAELRRAVDQAAECGMSTKLTFDQKTGEQVLYVWRRATSAQ